MQQNAPVDSDAAHGSVHNIEASTPQRSISTSAHGEGVFWSAVIIDDIIMVAMGCTYYSGGYISLKGVHPADATRRNRRGSSSSLNSSLELTRYTASASTVRYGMVSLSSYITRFHTDSRNTCHHVTVWVLLSLV